jgi:hypothetical protein
MWVEIQYKASVAVVCSYVTAIKTSRTNEVSLCVRNYFSCRGPFRMQKTTSIKWK